MTLRTYNSEAEFGKALVVAACGLQVLGHSVADALESLYEKLAERNADWTHRRVKSLYFCEARVLHFVEVADLLQAVRARDVVAFDACMKVVVDEFIGGSA